VGVGVDYRALGLFCACLFVTGFYLQCMGYEGQTCACCCANFGAGCVLDKLLGQRLRSPEAVYLYIFMPRRYEDAKYYLKLVLAV
jgi:hypothetical protein